MEGWGRERRGTAEECKGAVLINRYQTNKNGRSVDLRDCSLATAEQHTNRCHAARMYLENSFSVNSNKLQPVCVYLCVYLCVYVLCVCVCVCVGIIFCLMGIDLFLLMNCINRPFLFAVSSPTAQKKKL